MFVDPPQSLKRSSKAKWLLVLAVLLTAAMTIAILGKLDQPFGLLVPPKAEGVLINSTQTNAPETTLSIGKDDTATVTGIVYENVKQCTVDLSCFLRLKFQGEDVNIVYVNSEGQPCINEQASHQGLAIKKDQRVEAYGRYHKEGKLHIISTCPSNTFYIKVLPPFK